MSTGPFFELIRIGKFPWRLSRFVGVWVALRPRLLPNYRMTAAVNGCHFVHGMGQLLTNQVERAYLRHLARPLLG
jgi:hypothetical protein